MTRTVTILGGHGFSLRVPRVNDVRDPAGARMLVIPGNHEFFLEADPQRERLISNAKVLMDEAVEIEGLKIYGSGMTPSYGAAFGKASPDARIRHWRQVPGDVNVLITQGPPYRILDRSPGQIHRTGHPELTSRVTELPSLRLHCFGHVHGAYGTHEQNGVVFVNAALLDHLGGIERQPFAFRLHPDPLS